MLGKKLHFGEKKTRVIFEINLKKIVFLQSSFYKPDSLFKVSCDKHRTDKLASRDVNVSLLTSDSDGAMFSVNFEQCFQIAVSLYQDETCIILNSYLIKPIRFTVKQISTENKGKEVVQDVGTFSLNINEYSQCFEPEDRQVEFVELLTKGFAELSIRNISTKNPSLERFDIFGDGRKSLELNDRIFLSKRESIDSLQVDEKSVSDVNTSGSVVTRQPQYQQTSPSLPLPHRVSIATTPAPSNESPSLPSPPSPSLSLVGGRPSTRPSPDESTSASTAAPIATADLILNEVKAIYFKCYKSLFISAITVSCANAGGREPTTEQASCGVNVGESLLLATSAAAELS